MAVQSQRTGDQWVAVLGKIQSSCANRSESLELPIQLRLTQPDRPEFHPANFSQVTETEPRRFDRVLRGPLRKSPTCRELSRPKTLPSQQERQAWGSMGGEKHSPETDRSNFPIFTRFFGPKALTTEGRSPLTGEQWPSSAALCQMWAFATGIKSVRDAGSWAAFCQICLLGDRGSI